MWIKRLISVALIKINIYYYICVYYKIINIFTFASKLDKLNKSNNSLAFWILLSLIKEIEMINNI